MKKDEIFTEIKKIIKKYQIGDSPIELSTNLGSLGIDSINYIRVITDIESIYDFEFKDEILDFRNIDSIDVIVEYVNQQIN